MPTYPRSRLERAVVLLFATGAIAALTLACSLLAFQLRLLGAWVLDAESWLVGAVFAAIAGAIAYPFMLWLLSGTDLRRSLPRVAITTIGVTSLTAFVVGPLAMVPGLLAGIAVMVSCRRSCRLQAAFPEELTRPF